MKSIFNIVSMYKFSINGKMAIVQASSLINAMEEIERAGYSNYRFIAKLS